MTTSNESRPKDLRIFYFEGVPWGFHLALQKMSFKRRFYTSDKRQVGCRVKERVPVGGGCCVALESGAFFLGFAEF